MKRLAMDIEIGEATQSGREQVAELYADAGYGAPIGPSDKVLVATSCGQLVGAVRLCREHGVTVLRGKQIRSAFQRQGLGARLLAACGPWLDRGVAFCLPYAHLTGFYGAVGFEPVNAAELPEFLARRREAYLANGQDVVVAMRRNTVFSPHRRCHDLIVFIVNDITAVVRSKYKSLQIFLKTDAMKSQTAGNADSRNQHYLTATVGSCTERGGQVVSPDDCEEGSYIGGHKIACVGDVVRYPDGSESMMVSGAGDAYVIDGKPVAIVGSHLANDDRIVSSLQSTEELVFDATVELPRGFLQPGFKPSPVTRRA